VSFDRLAEYQARHTQRQLGLRTTAGVWAQLLRLGFAAVGWLAV
jgi:hypothetical protein